MCQRRIQLAICCCMDPTTGVYRPEASTATPPKIDALLMTERSTGLYSWDGALLLGASFFLKNELPRTVKPCHSSGPLV